MAAFLSGLDSTIAGAKPAGNGPPDVRPGELLQLLIDRGRTPFSVIDFPRMDEHGQPIQKVMIRVLTVREENIARSRARIAAAHALKQKTAEQIPDEIIQNETITHMLAASCFDPENPEKPFFRHPDEADTFCTSDELGVLALEYALLRQRSGPRMAELSESEMELWIEGASEDAALLPFSALQHAKLVMLFAYAAKCLVALRQQLASPTPHGSSPSAS